MAEEDKELERIRLKKLKEMLKRQTLREKRAVEKQRKIIDKPLELTDSTFTEFVQNNPFVVVDCWAPWCGPCLMVAPIIEELAKEYAGKIVFGKLNVDENPITASRYQIMSIPTLLVFRNGKLVDTIIGAMPKDCLLYTSPSPRDISGSRMPSSA